MFFKITFLLLCYSMCISVLYAEDGEIEGAKSYSIHYLSVNGGLVKFNGSIVSSPCVVSVDTTQQSVGLGSFQSFNFKEIGNTSSMVPFKIELKDCDISTIKTIAIAFDGPLLNGTTDVLAPVAIEAAESIASGVGIQILQNSQVLQVNGSEFSDFIDLLEGNNTLYFQVRYIAKSNSVSIGSANSFANFTIRYQ